LFDKAEDKLRKISLDDEAYYKIQLEFKQKTKRLSTHQSKTIYYLSFLLLLQFALGFVFRSGIFYYTRYLYQDSIHKDPDESSDSSPFKLGPFRINLIFAYFLYLEELVRHFLNWKRLEMSKHKLQMQRSEEELFLLVKMRPHIGTKNTNKEGKKISNMSLSKY